MSTIVIRYGGTDITDDVVLNAAEFKSRTDSLVGDAYFRVLDRKSGTYTKDHFKAGTEVTLDVDGVRVWGGYVQSVTYNYPGEAWKVAPTEPRFFTIRCVDYNILFHRRVLWNKAEPDHQMKQYTASGGPDSDKQIIRDMVNLYLDLSGDGFESGGGDAIDLSNVEELGDIFWLENCSTTWQAASPGMKWGDAMKHICAWSGGVFYIGPANPSQTHKGPTLYYHDVNSVTGPYELNDRPASDPGSAGVQSFDHIEDITNMATEALVWGAGMGSDEMVFHRETATTEQSTYGTWQWADFTSTMWLLECIKHRAKTYIHGSRQNKRGHKIPKETWKCTIFTPDFQVGDTVDMHSYIFDIQDNVPIREMTITFIGPTTPRFDLVMSHEMDTAYGTTMWWDPDYKPPDPGWQWPDPPGWSNWYNQTIPLGVGLPIITPGPENPPGESRYTCAEGPDAVLVDKVRWWSNGTVQRLGPNFLPFDGNTDFGSYLNRTGNRAWYACPCFVGLGCWGGDSAKVQYIYKIIIPAGFNNTLYVLGQQIKYQGQPGDFEGSLITDEDTYNNFHDIDYSGEAGTVPAPGISMSGGSIGGAGSYTPNNGWDGGFVDYTVTGENPLDHMAGGQPILDGRLPPRQAGECVYYHWYSGCWGGYSYIPTIAISNPPAGQNIYLVFTPGWDVAPIGDAAAFICDNGYYAGGIARGQGPAAEGLGGSGSYELPIRLDTIVCGGSGYVDDGPSPIDNTGVGYYQAPVDKIYYTHFPYVPGTLEVYLNGVPYHGFVEVDPATGQFSVHIGGIYSYSSFDIRYVASSPDPTEHGGMGEYYSDEGNDGLEDDAGGPLGGAVLRPQFRSAFGWKTEYDGSNVPFAQICHFIERTTQGTTVTTPPAVRTTSGITAHGQIGISTIRDILRQYSAGFWFPGTVSWESVKAGINEGRGAILVGDPARLGAFAPFTGLGTFDGPHALYINEIRKDGWMLVYDSAMRSPDRGVYFAPESVIKDYAASGASDRYGVANVIFTYRTQRV